MTDAYQVAASLQSQETSVVVKFDFVTPIYVTSHTVNGISGTVFQGALIPKSAVSQRLNPDDSRAEIGSISFSVLDTGITSEFKSRLDSGEGLKRTVVEVFRGGRNDEFSDFAKVQTQIIENQVSVGNKRYQFTCSDIQRSMKKDIFEPAETNITASLTTSGTSLNVVSTDDFEPCPHTSSFTDGPNQSLYYVKIENGDEFEIISATGKTSNSFTGLTRGLFFTSPVQFDYDSNESAENQIKVSEYVYLEMPVPAMAYAILTGQIINGGTLPTNWHLGIDPSWVNLDSFQNIGSDWFDPNDYTKGLIYRFDGIDTTEGKLFIEKEVLRLIGFMPINGDGELVLRRISRIIENSDYRYLLNSTNVVKHSDLKYNLSKTANIIDLRWGYVDVPNQTTGYTRQTFLYDAPSVSTHKGEYRKSLSMRGLHNSRHTKTVITNLFNAYRDRYSNPPLELSLDLLPSVYDLQVGDTVKVQLANLIDPVTDAFVDRTFEVQNVSTNLVNGLVKVSLFASSGDASVLTDDGAGNASELPDGWYPTQGSNASSILSVDGSGILTSDGVLSGGANSRAWFYFLGDLTIPTGRTLTIDKNVGFAVRGQFQIDGTIKVEGGGANNFIGSTIGGPGIRDGGPSAGNTASNETPGQNETMPTPIIDNEAGVLTGIPNDMGGTDGPSGRLCYEWIDGDLNYEPIAGTDGGVGGIGGGSLVVVARGAGFGISGLIDVSGEDGNVGSISGNVQGGSGGGGAPGSMLFLIDGNTNTFPILATRIRAEYGLSPAGSVGKGGKQGKAKSVIDLGTNNARVFYVPASREVYPSYGIGNPATLQNGLSVAELRIYRRESSAPATPSGGSFNFGVQALTPPTDWSSGIPAGNDPVYICTVLATASSPTGTDTSLSWSAPALAFSNGQDGNDGVDGSDGSDGAPGTDGQDGQAIDIIFKRSAAQPSTPASSSGTPSGWQSDVASVPASSDSMWTSVGMRLSPNVNWSWQTPVKIEGTDGSDGQPGLDGQDGADGSANIGGSGVNLIPIKYINFEQADMDGGNVKRGTRFTTFEADTDTKFIGTRSLRLVAIDSPDSTKFAGLFIHDDAQLITIEPNQKWILSFYIYHQGANNESINFCGNAYSNYDVASNSSEVSRANVSIPFTSNGSWVRYSMVIDFSTLNGTFLRGYLLFSNGFDGWIDGIQLEKKVGDLNGPSPLNIPGGAEEEPRFNKSAVIKEGFPIGKRTVSTSAPTGTPEDGDEWYQYDS